MDFKFNFNDSVKVRLTNFGIEILKQQHNELNSRIKNRGGKGLGEFSVNVDEEGYTTFQLWSLISKFGHVMQLGREVPFNGNMIFKNGNPVEGGDIGLLNYENERMKKALSSIKQVIDTY